MPFFCVCLNLITLLGTLQVELWEHDLRSLVHAMLCLPCTATSFLPSIVGAWGLFCFVWLQSGGRRSDDCLVFLRLGCIFKIFLFTAFIHQWQFINSACFTMISALSAKQLYDFVPLFDSYLALSPGHNYNK